MTKLNGIEVWMTIVVRDKIAWLNLCLWHKNKKVVKESLKHSYIDNTKTFFKNKRKSILSRLFLQFKSLKLLESYLNDLK